MRRGVTLVELLIVIVIVVILVAVALPLVKYAMSDYALREGARQVNAAFATAKANAAASGRPAGVWLELERVGDPTTPIGVYQCSQLYQAEVPSPYAGDVLDAICLVRQAGPPWAIDFQATGASLSSLVADGDTFRIQLDLKGHWFLGRRNGGTFQILPEANGLVVPNRPPWFGADKAPGIIGVDDDGNGIIDDFSEWGMGDDGPRSIYAKYKIHRSPQRIGQSIDLPQGVVIDLAYSGAGPDGNQFSAAKGRVLVMFSPAGGVSSVSLIDQQSGNIAEDVESSKVFLLVGRTEHVYLPWQSVPQSNLADGSNYWVTVNRRNGSVGTTENAPNVNLPFGTAAERATVLSTAREFAAKAEVKGGQ